ncbi:hypothetical protein Ccrd_011285 [Cynara cardunculus var. scolymus]|uniref:Lipase, GDSL n=1 Tax=Cynara cardunculus var. scolymus TaxID=59895 RepID=A0A103YJN2_CYNCS|nr:hypothetical protein Ccrd_011285 [Cynara cardunculus var. scolymus]
MPAPAGATSVHGLTAFLVFSGLIRLGVCQPHQAAPAVYMIGDSLVDVGNNNYLPLSIAKANFPHNGVDYPAGKPTGRFSNGQNAADFLDYFALVRDQLVQQLGPAAAQTHLSKSLFAIVIGSNDLFAYFTIGSIVSNQFNPQQYVDLMTSTFRNLLKTLYGMGARKVMVAGVGEIGCCPVQRKLNKTGECNVELNYWSAKYNDGLKIMLESLKSDSPGMNYAYFDTYGAMANLFQKPDTYGIMIDLFYDSLTAIKWASWDVHDPLAKLNDLTRSSIKEACCGLGNLNADVPCIPISRFCSNRKKYVFWDLYHPTEAVSSMFSDLLYSGSQEYTFPMNVKQLLDI